MGKAYWAAVAIGYAAMTMTAIGLTALTIALAVDAWGRPATASTLTGMVAAAGCAFVAGAAYAGIGAAVAGAVKAGR